MNCEPETQRLWQHLKKYQMLTRLSVTKKKKKKKQTNKETKKLKRQEKNGQMSIPQPTNFVF